MDTHKQPTRRKDTTPDHPPALEYWVKRTHELPEVRIDKVRSTREALERNAYESDQILDDTIAKLNDELDLLLSRAPEDTPE